MRWIWKRRWIVLPLAVAIILAVGAVGAVALASPGDNAVSAGTTSAAAVTVTTASPGGAAAGDLADLAGTLGQGRAKLLQRLENLKQRWAAARSKMSPQDQAAFDQFLQTAKGQRDTLKQDRQSLLDTLKSMRDLVKKYQPATTTTSTPTT